MGNTTSHMTQDASITQQPSQLHVFNLKKVIGYKKEKSKNLNTNILTKQMVYYDDKISKIRSSLTKKLTLRMFEIGSGFEVSPV
jgi:hypothetical protein